MGKPIITSDMSFAHVVCKDAAVYFNPVDSVDITNKLISLVTDNKLQEQIVKNGKEQLLQFGTSEDRAKEVLRLCKSLL